MEKRQLFDENGNIKPFDVTEFDMVTQCLLRSGRDGNRRTQECKVLDAKYNNREALVLGLISGDIELLRMEPDDTLELRMFKGNKAYCIEIGNKSSDVSDEWCFFTALPDEGKRFAIDNFADVTDEWCWSCLKEENVGGVLDWDTFVSKYMVNVERGLEVTLEPNMDINLQIDEASFIFNDDNDLMGIAMGIADGEDGPFKLSSDMVDESTMGKVKDIVEYRRRQVMGK